MQSILNYLFDNPGRVKLFFISKIFNQLVPFNSPHGFHFKQLSQDKIQIKLPYKRKNMNHLRGVHACAMATLGEYCAGILLLRNFGTKSYRYILSQLKVEYFYQGRMDLLGEAHVGQEQIEKLKNDLITMDKTLIEVQTHISDIKGNKVAIVFSTWQLKLWDKVKTK